MVINTTKPTPSPFSALHIKHCQSVITFLRAINFVYCTNKMTILEFEWNSIRSSTHGN